MNINITTSERIFARAELASVLRIDFIVFMLLIGLLILREFLSIYYVKNTIDQPHTKHTMGRLIDIIIIPFLYIFLYVIIFRLLNTV